jgi:transposase
MGTVRTDEFRKDAARIALTSRLSRQQIADDLGVGISTLTKWITAHRATAEIGRRWPSLTDQISRRQFMGA